VDHRMRNIGLALLWTAALGAVLLLVDRALFGPSAPSGWVETERLEDVPRRAGALVTPAYLPNSLRWPPAKVFYRIHPDPGLWVGVVNKFDEVPLWIGTGTTPLPPALQPFKGCFEPNKEPCPASWYVSSVHLKSQAERGAVTYLLSRISRRQTARIAVGLELPE